MFIPAEILGEELATIYPYGIDPHAGHKVGRDGILLEAFEDKIITVDKLLDNIDLALDWYIPSDFAIEFIIFIRLVLGEEPENTSPKAHYFFIDCVFQQPNVKPFFMIRNIDYDDLKDRVVILASREFSKSTLVAYLILYMAAKGKVPGFGKVNYGLYVADSMRNNVETTMTTIKKVYQESKYLKSLFEDTRLIQTEVSFVRKPTTRKEIDAYQQAINVEKLKPDEVPGRMKRTFTLVGIGANTGGRGSRDGLARPDFTIFDDMLPSEAEANSDVILAKVESTIESDILPGMNNNGNFSIMIGTPYSKKDPVYRRIEQGTWLPVVFPRGNKLPTDEKTFISVWEDRHSYKNCRKDYVRAMRAKDAGDGSKLRSLLQEHYLRISSDEDRMITDSMVQWYNRTDVERRLAQYNVYMTTDFTTTGSSGSDMSGIAVWALGSNNDIFMLDLCLRRQELEEQYEEVFRMNKYWTKHAAKSITIGIETDGQQKGHVLAVKDRMIRKNEYMTIGKQKGSKPGSEGILSRLEKGNKHWRFRMMLPLFQNKKIYFPRELEDTPDMREMMDQIKYATYAGFGTKCDDGADLISQLGMMDMQFPMSSMYDEDDDYSATDDDDEGYGAPKRERGSFYKTGYKKEKVSSVYDLYN